MSERANFQQGYLYRYLLIVAILWPYGLYFAYDGFIGYPSQIKYSREYDKLREIENLNERAARWEAIIDENGWSQKKLMKDHEKRKTVHQIEEDIHGQYWYAGLCFLVGLIPFVYFLRARNSWVETTPNGLTTSWGQSLEFKNVVKLDKKKWENKGIAKATYRDEGRTRTFVFDDFKYARNPLGAILRDLEATLRPEQIVGGPPESTDDSDNEEEDYDDDDSDRFAEESDSEAPDSPESSKTEPEKGKPR